MHTTVKKIDIKKQKKVNTDMLDFFKDILRFWSRVSKN